MNQPRDWHTLLTTSMAVLLTVFITASLVSAESLDDAVAETACDPVDTYFNSLKVFGLTRNGRLVRFRVSVPHVTKNIGAVSGLQAPDTSLVGIDFRVQDGKLYGVGNGGGIYTIDTTNAQAALVNRLSIALQGTFFGVDFNPAANRLRIISDTGQNLRHDVTGTTTPPTSNDGTLNYPPVPPATTPTIALGVTGAAYTNNDLDTTTATTLFDIDTALNQVVIQSPANSGMLAATGQLGRDADTRVGFDIASRLVKGVARQNRAFASLLVNGNYGFYGINLLTGKASFLGDLSTAVIDIAVSLQ